MDAAVAYYRGATMTETNWLTLKEAAAHSKISERTLQRWIEQKFLLNGIHYGGDGANRRFNRPMLDVAILLQSNPEAHKEAIAVKRRELFGRKRNAS